MRAHSTFAPSSASRHLHCTPSLRLEEFFPDTESSAAREGTDAHALAEYKLRTWLGLEAEEPEISKEWDRFEMEEHTDAYVHFIQNTANKLNPYPIILPEQRVNFDNWIEGGFGTTDCILISDDVLHVIDFKYGRNFVNAKNNVQMMVYALGALQEYAFVYPGIQKVRMTIFQPRANYIGTFEVSVAGLYNWAENILKIRGNMALNGEGTLEAGDWCKYCKAKGVCNKQRELVADSFEKIDATKDVPANLMSVEEVSDLLPKAQELRAWCDSLEEAASSLAKNGADIKGYGFADGKKTRIFSDEQGVIERAIELGIEDQIYNLKSPSQIEKAIGKAKFAIAFAEFVEDKKSKPVFKAKGDKK